MSAVLPGKADQRSARGRALLSYENRVLLILAATGGVAGIDMLALNFLNPFVAAELNLDNAQIGLVGAVSMIAWSVSAIVIALISDRRGRRRPYLVAAMVAFALFSAVTALARSFVMLLAARALVGLAEGPVIPMQNTIMNDASSEHRRGLNIGIVQNFGSQLLGALAGPLLLVWVATHLGGWRSAFLIAGLPALAMAVIVQFSIREAAPAASRPAPAPLGRALAEIAGERNIQLCFLTGICAISWFGIVLTFTPLWAIRVLHFTPAAMSLVMGSFGAAGAVAAIVVPGLSDRIGRRPAMVIFALVGTALPLGLLFGPADLGSACAVIFAGGLFMGIFPLFIGVVPMESVAARHFASALAIVMGCAQIIGGVIGPLIGGLAADLWSLRAPLWMACGLAIAAAVAAAFLRETRLPALKSKAASSII